MNKLLNCSTLILWVVIDCATTYSYVRIATDWWLIPYSFTDGFSPKILGIFSARDDYSGSLL